MPTFQYYRHQLRVLPLRKIIRRANEIATWSFRDLLGKVRAHIFGTTMSDRDFIARAFGGAFPDKDTLFAHFRVRTKPSFFVALNNMTAALSELSPPETEAILSLADKICDHVFDLLGSGDVHLGDSIDWHRDFKTGYRWSAKTYYSDVKIPYGKADIKVPWELSRFSHAAVLGQAYLLTNNEKYAKEFVSQVSDWINTNKPKFGVNWNCSMDVAIRACNWILGYAYLREAPAFTDAFLLKFLKSLYQHGLHIRTNLEYSETLTSNHYLSDIVGLVYLGVMFPEFKDGPAWKEFGVREITREMEKQVYRDGCDFEGSTCYHRLVLELFFFAALLVVKNDENFIGDNFSDIARKVFGHAYTDRLCKMFEAVLHLLKPNGKMPQIGDNDSGRLHVFADRDNLDMRYLLTFGAVFFREPAFKVREFGFCEESVWLFGRNGREIWGRLDEHSLADIGSIAFPDAGWYIMRSNRDYMIISCGPNGQNGNGGHCHNDKLSFELCIGGEDVIVDPGTHVYTPEPDARNFFRATAQHNTVQVDSTEQNNISGSDFFLFILRDETKAMAHEWHMDADRTVFMGEHYGYQRLPNGVVHQREIIFEKTQRKWKIVDRFFGSGTHAMEWNFNLTPKTSRAARLHAENIRWQKQRSYFSPEYGVKMLSGRLTARLTVELPFENTIWIIPDE